jgi:hypothetical protein
MVTPSATAAARSRVSTVVATSHGTGDGGGSRTLVTSMRPASDAPRSTSGNSRAAGSSTRPSGGIATRPSTSCRLTRLAVRLLSSTSGEPSGGSV